MVIVIGAGPAGLMAAQVLADGGEAVCVCDAMASVGRKFLLAGKGGLNLTHSEGMDAFASRYGERRAALEPMLAAFGPQALREWAQGLGVATFVGTSGRVFPQQMKAAPLLRAWLHRLRASGVRFHMRHRWTGWDETGALRFETPDGPVALRADALVLALGGGSWPRLGSDGAWVPLLQARGVQVRRLRASNCGFDAAWSEHFSARFAGHPVKAVRMSFDDAQGHGQADANIGQTRQGNALSHGVARQGEFVVTQTGIEGSLVYAFSGAIRDHIDMHGHAVVHLDLAPGREAARLADELSRPRGARSMANHLRMRAGIEGVRAGLLRECLSADVFADPLRLAAAIKRLPLRLIAARPLAEAISTAGGVAFESLTPGLMIEGLPGVFCAGEMLDWEAPTGGYLLTASFSTGRAAGFGALAWLRTERINN